MIHHFFLYYNNIIGFCWFLMILSWTSTLFIIIILQLMLSIFVSFQDMINWIMHCNGGIIHMFMEESCCADPYQGPTRLWKHICIYVRPKSNMGHKCLDRAWPASNMSSYRLPIYSIGCKARLRLTLKNDIEILWEILN